MRTIVRRGSRAAAGGVRAVAMLAAVAASASCGGDAGEARVGGTAVLVDAAGPVAANPLVTTESYSQAMNAWLLYLPLLRPGPDLAPEPGLAESVEMEGDSVAVLRLRRDVLWTDSVPVSAHDAVFTIERALDPETGYGNAQQVSHVRSAEAVDSFTLRLRMRPVRDPLLGLAMLPILPRHVLDTIPAAAMRSAAFNLRPVTSGPFRVAEARPNDRWVFAANELFPESLGGRPNLDRLVWRVIPESSAQMAELRAGEADLVAGVRADALADTAVPGIRRVKRPTLSYVGIAWNGRRPPLDDARVRRALTLAIDRRSIVEGLRGGHGSLAAAPVPPGHWAYAEEVEPPPYDPAAARAALEESGYRDRDGDGVVESPDGEPLRVTLLIPAGSDLNRDLAQVIQSDLRQVGVAMEIRALEANTMFGVIASPERNFDSVLLQLDADARMNLRNLFHGRDLDNPYQVAGYSDPVVDSLLDVVELTRDREAAMPAWTALQERLARDQPWSFLYFLRDVILVRDRLHGVDADLRGILHSAPAWWLEPAAEGTGG